jgi:AcrR family transcriptional regulator
VKTAQNPKKGRKSKSVAVPAVPIRQRATQQRTIDTRRKIIESAVEEFARYGYEGASTRTVATKAGAQHTLVTYHFKGKEGLWRAAISSLLTEHAERFTQRMEGLRGVDATTKLRLIKEDFIRFSAESLNFHRIMSHVAASQSKQLDWLIDEYLRYTFDSRAGLIREAQAAGRFIEGDPYHLEYIFIGAVTRIFMLAAEVEKIMGRSPFTPEFVDEHVRICIGLFFRDPPEGIKAARKPRTAKVGRQSSLGPRAPNQAKPISASAPGVTRHTGIDTGRGSPITPGWWRANGSFS